MRRFTTFYAKRQPRRITIGIEWNVRHHEDYHQYDFMILLPFLCLHWYHYKGY